MLHQPERHEPLSATPWNESEARELIETLVRDCDSRFAGAKFWPWHPKDVEPGDDLTQPALPLYHGAAGVVWALHYLQDVGAVAAGRRYESMYESLLERNRAWLRNVPFDAGASYMAGDVPILLMMQNARPMQRCADVLAALIEGNVAHPARELMWGSPGTMLAALFLHQRFGEPRWADLFRTTAAQLKSQLEWSDELRCHYWTQELYGRRTTYLDAIHGFVATAHVLTKGRELLADPAWREWQSTIATTIVSTAVRENGFANWRVQLTDPREPPRGWFMQFCHGAPGFVICLGSFPDSSLDALLLEAGEAIWNAGPLRKGSNLCHGTGGNGYAFLKLYERTGDCVWLDRARAFAMHGIAQTRNDEREYGQYRYSLWTGDLGFAIYLWDCLRAKVAFPTLDVF